MYVYQGATRAYVSFLQGHVLFYPKEKFKPIQTLEIYQPRDEILPCSIIDRFNYEYLFTMWSIICVNIPKEVDTFFETLEVFRIIRKRYVVSNEKIVPSDLIFDSLYRSFNETSPRNKLDQLHRYRAPRWYNIVLREQPLSKHVLGGVPCYRSTVYNR